MEPSSSTRTIQTLYACACFRRPQNVPLVFQIVQLCTPRGKALTMRDVTRFCGWRNEGGGRLSGDLRRGRRRVRQTSVGSYKEHPHVKKNRAEALSSEGQLIHSTSRSRKFTVQQQYLPLT